MKRIYLIGDSTCQVNDESTYPQYGWGQVFEEYVKDDYEVIDLALNGTSTKSFFNNGCFEMVEESISEGDYLFIQFGHNDEKNDEERHTEPFKDYQSYLKIFVDAARGVKAIPVLLSPIYRRHFKLFHLDKKCHGNYPKAMKQLAEKEGVIFIDMTSLTKKYIEGLGKEKSKELFMNFGPNIYPNYPEGLEDNTHLREKGARAVCEIIKKECLNNDILKDIIK